MEKVRKKMENIRWKSKKNKLVKTKENNIIENGLTKCQTLKEKS